MYLYNTSLELFDTKQGIADSDTSQACIQFMINCSF
jgi:hypothetical protein